MNANAVDRKKELREKIERSTDEQKIFPLITLSEMYPGTSDTVLILMNQALALLKKYPNHNTKAYVYNQLGKYYVSLDKTKIALSCYLKSVREFTIIHDELGLSRVYNNMGLLYFAVRNFTKAKQYYSKALQLKQTLKDSSGAVSALNNIAALQYEIDQYDSAVANFISILENFSSKLNRQYEADITQNIACCFSEMNKPIDGLIYYKQATAIYEELNNPEDLSMCYGNLSKVYVQLKDYPNALVYGKKALETAEKINSKTLAESACSALRMMYYETGDYKKAYEYMKYEMALKDTMYDRESKAAITEMQTKYETAEKEKENKLLSTENKIQSLELNRNRYFIFALSGMLIAGILITFLFVRQNRIKNRQRALLAEQKLLRAQMNPHFIFNSLTAIESFIYTNKPREAGRYMSDFARLMRLILENSREEEISVSSEIQTLEYYLTMQKLRLEDKLTWTVRTENIADTSELLIPPMLTQPFIENAIEHGIGTNNEPGKVDVLFSLKNELLSVEVTDNGIGILQAEANKNQNKKYKSLALEITRERLQNHNRNRKNKITLAITDLSTLDSKLTGTRITFTMPIT